MFFVKDFLLCIATAKAVVVYSMYNCTAVVCVTFDDARSNHMWNISKQCLYIATFIHTYCRYLNVYSIFSSPACIPLQQYVAQTFHYVTPPAAAVQVNPVPAVQPGVQYIPGYPQQPVAPGQYPAQPGIHPTAPAASVDHQNHPDYLIPAARPGGGDSPPAYTALSSPDYLTTDVSPPDPSGRYIVYKHAANLFCIFFGI